MKIPLSHSFSNFFLHSFLFLFCSGRIIIITWFARPRQIERGPYRFGYQCRDCSGRCRCNPALDLSNQISNELQYRIDSFDVAPQHSNIFKLYFNPKVLFKSNSEKTPIISGDKVNQVNGTLSLMFNGNSWRKDESKK